MGVASSRLASSRRSALSSPWAAAGTARTSAAAAPAPSSARREIGFSALRPSPTHRYYFDGNGRPANFPGTSATARHHPGRQRLDMRADLARARQPHAVPVLEDVLQGPAQPPDPVRPAEHERA